MVVIDIGKFGITSECVLHFDIVFSINRFRFNSSSKEVDILQSFGDIVGVKTKCGDRVGEQFTSILYECYLFGLNEVKYSLNSFNVGGFVGDLIGPFDGVTNKCSSSFNDVHNFIGSLGSGLDSSDDGHWVNEILEVEFSSIEVVFQSSKVDNGWLKCIWVTNHLVKLH